jgi:hypothetical protein
MAKSYNVAGFNLWRSDQPNPDLAVDAPPALLRTEGAYVGRNPGEQL